MKGDRSRSEIYRLAALLYPRSSVAEAYRTLRTNIEFASVDAPIRTLLVTSSIPGEGKTTTASNLAVVFAQAGRRVLLVDADLRKPGVHLVFDLPNTHGLTNLLRNEHADLDAVAQATEQDNLRVLTTGPLPPNPAELLGSQRMRSVLEQLEAGFDLVIFDSPPLQAVTDSAILSSFLGGTLLVIDARRSRRRVVHQARESLDRAGARVLGAVLNRIPTKTLTPYAGYGGVYGAEAQRVTKSGPEAEAFLVARPPERGRQRPAGSRPSITARSVSPRCSMLCSRVTYVRPAEPIAARASGVAAARSRKASARRSGSSGRTVTPPRSFDRVIGARARENHWSCGCHVLEQLVEADPVPVDRCGCGMHHRRIEGAQNPRHCRLGDRRTEPDGLVRRCQTLHAGESGPSPINTTPTRPGARRSATAAASAMTSTQFTRPNAPR